MPLDAFHPTIVRWFRDEVGEPSAPQRDGWPAIRDGADCLIAAPTGSGKTFAAFLHALDTLLRQPRAEDSGTRVLYVSPLKALSNDIQKNLSSPLARLRELDPDLPDISIAVRSGDTPTTERARMLRKPPDVLVTTPESLYVLLTSAGGLSMLRSVETVILDEIHALASNKRGTHLSLTLERLDHWLASAQPGRRRPQRIGLSATQRPLARIADFLVGNRPSGSEPCRIVDSGHLRELDLALEVPDSPLTAICADESWNEVYAKIVRLIDDHRTTLIFANTRKMAERTARRLTETLGTDHVTSHHGSLSRARRLEAERRLKAGELRALCATASLELGIDIGDVDLVIQLGVPATIATFLQRVGRAGHGAGQVPKGRLFALTRDDAVAGAAMLRAVRNEELDEILVPTGALDILGQQIVATCTQIEMQARVLGRTGDGCDSLPADELLALCRSAWPYKDLDRQAFDATVQMYSEGRLAMLHRDGVRARLRATKRARMPALTSGGAIPDTGEVELRTENDNQPVGTVSEDFAIESSIGDVFQFGNTSWQITGFDRSRLMVKHAGDRPATLPFWFGEAPARSRELSAAVTDLRRIATDESKTAAECGIDPGVARQIAEHARAAIDELGTIPTTEEVVLERFFDDTGGMQLVLHAPFGVRINRAWGLALRKKFCRGFGFELQAAADEDSIVISLGPMHAFPLEEVFDYVHPNTARDTLIQALLPTPMFKTRWRWNVSRALVVPRMNGGRKVPPPLQRARADDALAAAFPEVMACGETLPPGDLPVPLDHPLVGQTVQDCLEEAMDVDGMIAVLHGLRSGRIAKHSIDRPTPSRWAAAILTARPYAFLDDAPLEERRTATVRSGRTAATDAELGELDPAVVHRIREEAWPAPTNAEEVHEALLWIGFVEVREVPGWLPWLESLHQQGRAAAAKTARGTRWFATEAPREPLALVLRGRMEALGPIEPADESERTALLELQARGEVFQVRLDGKTCWCNRRMLARIHAGMRDTSRPRFEPIAIDEYLAFLESWQGVGSDTQHEDVLSLLEQLSGTVATARSWESEILGRRVLGGEAGARAALDELGIRGDIVWARLWGSSNAAPRSVRFAFLPRRDLRAWRGLRSDRRVSPADLSASASTLFEILTRHGASFVDELADEARLLPSHLEEGLGELVTQGLATCDSFVALRGLLVAPSKRPNRARENRHHRPFAAGRWSLLPAGDRPADDDELAWEMRHEFVFDRLIARYGVLFRRVLLHEQQGALPTWRELVRVGRRRELEGAVVGGRFIAGCSGEQFALPTALPRLHSSRNHGPTLAPGSDPAAPAHLLEREVAAVPAER